MRHGKVELLGKIIAEDSFPSSSLVSFKRVLGDNSASSSSSTMIKRQLFLTVLEESGTQNTCVTFDDSDDSEASLRSRTWATFDGLTTSMTAKIKLLAFCVILLTISHCLGTHVIGSSFSDTLFGGQSEYGEGLFFAGETNPKEVLAMTLLHRDHQQSPLSHSVSSTLKERFTRALQRSHARKEGLRHLGKPHDIVGRVYSSPGEYVMTGKLGTPAVDFVAIVDTGSDLIWLQCDPCIECTIEKDDYFNPRKSSTYKRLSCNSKLCSYLQSGCNPMITNSLCSYLYTYGDKSFTTGLLSSETALWNTTRGRSHFFPDVAFGCSTKSRGQFSGADGLLGFGVGPLSLPSQIGPKVGKQFSYCFIDFTFATNQSSYLTVGNGTFRIPHRVQYTPIVRNRYYPTFYYLQLESIKIEGHKLNIPPEVFGFDIRGNGGNIIDSGTTLTYLIEPAYEAVVNHFRGLVRFPIVKNASLTLGLDLCFDLTKNPQAILPAMSFHFHGTAAMHLPMENTFITVEEDGTIISCLAMASSRIDEFGIIGNIQQQNFRVIYDLENERLGFAKQKCAR